MVNERLELKRPIKNRQSPVLDIKVDRSMPSDVTSSNDQIIYT